MSRVSFLLGTQIGGASSAGLNLRHYVCDTEADMPATGISAGSSAYCIQEATLWHVNGNNTWAKVSGGAGGGDMYKSDNLSGLQSSATARTNLGLGSAAVLAASAILLAANNLSDVSNAASARTNLGLGTLATQSGTFSGTSSGTNTGDQNLAGLQPADATLTALAAANWIANAIPVGNGADTLAQITCAANTFLARGSAGNLVAKTITDFGLSLVDDADAATSRATLGLGTLATQSGTFSGTSSGTNTGDQTNISGNAATVTTNANLTGPITSSGNATAVAAQTGTGSKFVMDTSPVLVTPNLGVASATSVAATGALTSSGTAGIGYATGAGGTVTQATSKATTVVLNKLCGTIVLNAAALAAGAIVTFIVTNSTAAATDIVCTQHDSAGTLGAYTVTANTPAAGSFKISVRNNTAGSLSEAIVIRFAVIKAVVA